MVISSWQLAGRSPRDRRSICDCSISDLGMVGRNDPHHIKTLTESHTRLCVLCVSHCVLCVKTISHAKSQLHLATSRLFQPSAHNFPLRLCGFVRDKISPQTANSPIVADRRPASRRAVDGFRLCRAGSGRPCQARPKANTCACVRPGLRPPTRNRHPRKSARSTCRHGL